MGLIFAPMVALLAVLLAAPWSTSTEAIVPPSATFPAEPLAADRDERSEHLLPPLRERSKKEAWLLQKAHRPDVRVSDADLAPKPRAKDARPKVAGTANLQAQARLTDAMEPVGTRILPIATIYSIWNREAMALIPGQPYKLRFQLFMRDHYTHESTQADTRLAGVLAAAATHFHTTRIDIVSGYRSPKYNLMLRKKGHQVARESQHTQGTAVDFRVRGASTEALRDFVRSLHLGGVGYYPRTHFVHADTGKVRYWQGS
jgi:Bacterial protein of unknown function (DUF882)